MTYNFHGFNMEVTEGSLEARYLDIKEKVDAFEEAINKGVKYEDLPFVDDFGSFVDDTWYTDLHEAVYDLYKRETCLSNMAYRNRYEAELIEYASHKDEPDFDWGFYSDWHKDVYGYRPRH